MKIEINEKSGMYPMPMTIVGSMVDGKPTFLAVAWIGIMSIDLVSIALNKARYTSKGIFENKTFSINIPDESMVVETDYVGIVSGNNEDKSNVFDVHYGKLKNAPMIVNAPVSMECELFESITNHQSHDIFIGKIAGVYADERVIAGGTIDLSLVKPMLFDMYQRKYWKLGESFADCWKIGKEYKKK